MTRGDHSKDVEDKGQKYVEVAEEPKEREKGNFFLIRYRQIDPSVRAIDGEKLQQALRVNTHKTTTEELMHVLNKKNALLQKIPFLQNGYFCRASFSLGSTPEYLLGYYYLQSPLSQLVCEVLAPTVGARVLDMASAPGGKTTYLAQLVGMQGMVVALDDDSSRLAAVRNNAERLGLTNVVCVKKDARFAPDLGMTYKFILLDAPCSGNFCSDENWFTKRKIEDIKNNARTQRELLRAAYLCLEPGGRIVYSTCSLEPEENELIINSALQKYPDLTVIPLDHLSVGDRGALMWNNEPLDPRLSGTRRFWPHKTSMEGFYIALLEKKTQ